MGGIIWGREGPVREKKRNCSSFEEKRGGGCRNNGKDGQMPVLGK